MFFGYSMGRIALSFHFYKRYLHAFCEDTLVSFGRLALSASEALLRCINCNNIGNDSYSLFARQHNRALLDSLL